MQLAYLAVSEAKRVCARHVMRATARETKRRDWIYETKHFVEKLKLNSGPQTTISAQKGQLVHRRVEVSSCYWISSPHTWHVNFLFFFCWNAITASPRLPKMNERIDSWQQCLAKATFSVTLSPKKGFHVTWLNEARIHAVTPNKLDFPDSHRHITYESIQFIMMYFWRL